MRRFAAAITWGWLNAEQMSDSLVDRRAVGVGVNKVHRVSHAGLSEKS
jgi:hypothetical protein